MLNIQTTIGSVEGFVDGSFPDVAQWLGIPFAEPPIGPRRFAKPTPKASLPASTVLRANTMPRAPMQARTTKADAYNQLLPEFVANGPYSEDCLYLNIFAPACRPSTPSPVFVWVHGGELSWGGINTEYYQPLPWVQRSKEHIVVLISYRVGIFGFPNPKNNDDALNLGILDQRLALEFLSANIAFFGGDPSRITAFGNAAGAVCLEAHLFAWPEDPIFSRIISQSGSILLARKSSDPERTSFTTAARKMGYMGNDDDSIAVFEFMRKVDAGALVGCITHHNDSGSEPGLQFRPRRDGKIMFGPEEYREKITAGKFAKMPMIVGTVSNEGASLGGYSRSGVSSRGLELWQSVFANSAADAVKFRSQNGMTTYQYLFDATFPNVSPLSWLGAYHFAEIPLIMGTHSVARGPSTELERTLSETMQDMWLAFGKNGGDGLEKATWNWRPAVSTDDGDASNVMVFGRDGVVYKMEQLPNGGRM